MNRSTIFLLGVTISILYSSELRQQKQFARQDMRTLLVSFNFIQVWRKTVKPGLDEYLKTTPTVRKQGLRHILELSFLDFKRAPWFNRQRERCDIFNRYEMRLLEEFDDPESFSYLR